MHLDGKKSETDSKVKDDKTALIQFTPGVIINKDENIQVVIKEPHFEVINENLVQM